MWDYHGRDTTLQHRYSYCYNDILVIYLHQYHLKASFHQTNNSTLIFTFLTKAYSRMKGCIAIEGSFVHSSKSFQKVPIKQITYFNILFKKLIFEKWHFTDQGNMVQSLKLQWSVLWDYKHEHAKGILHRSFIGMYRCWGKWIKDIQVFQELCLCGETFLKNIAKCKKEWNCLSGMGPLGLATCRYENFAIQDRTCDSCPDTVETKLHAQLSCLWWH